jgi:hypothetical protein
MKPEDSSPHSQDPGTCPYPQPDHSSPFPTALFLKSDINSKTASTSSPQHRKILAARLPVHLRVEALYEVDPSMGATWILNTSSDINGPEVATRDLRRHK